jgi:hypothetical protein
VFLIKKYFKKYFFKKRKRQNEHKKRGSLSNDAYESWLLLEPFKKHWAKALALKIK